MKSKRVAWLMCAVASCLVGLLLLPELPTWREFAIAWAFAISGICLAFGELT